MVSLKGEWNIKKSIITYFFLILFIVNYNLQSFCSHVKVRSKVGASAVLNISQSVPRYLIFNKLLFESLDINQVCTLRVKKTLNFLL